MVRVRALIGKLFPLFGFSGSASYWDKRYRFGGNSGAGSRGEPARYKAEVVNALIDRLEVASIIEFGCGDGHQLGRFAIPAYTGVDVSPAVVDHCRQMYAADRTKIFLNLRDYRSEQAEMALSLDVLFHLVEDEVYRDYMDRLFSAATKCVVVYSTDAEMEQTGTRHVRHRGFSKDVARWYPEFARLEDLERDLPSPVRFDRGLATSFFVYRRR